MMLHGRGIRDSASTYSRPVSRAQYQSALLSCPRHSPANRLTPRSTMTSFDLTSFDQYEATSPGRRRQSDDVVLPPVVKTPVRNPSSIRRPAKRGSRKLPTVMNNSNGRRRLAWYHEDGSLNLQALNHLATRQSFPRPQSSCGPLDTIHDRIGPPQSGGRASSDNMLIPLQFVDGDQLTPKKRAERDSLLHLLLSADDLTEQELEQIVRYISDQPDEEPTPRSCLKSPRPKSVAAEKKKKRGRPISRQSARSVRFQQPPPSAGDEEMTPLQLESSLPETPRAQSAPSLRTPFSASPLSARRSSDPFHVPSPASSPRAPESPDEEVAYFPGCESPPEIPASPKFIPEPKITYYDESGEEIEEDIQTKDQSQEGDKTDGRATPSEDLASCPDESPPSESSRRPVSPVSEAEPPLEHLPEEDMPQMDHDCTERVQSGPQPADTKSSHAQGRSVSDLTDSFCQTESLPRTIDAPAEKQRPESSPGDQDKSSPPPKKEEHGVVEKEKSSSPPPPQTPRPESAPTEKSSRPSRKSRPKSSKRHRSSRSASRSTERAQQCPSTEQTRERDSRKPLKPPHASPVAQSPPDRPEAAKEEPQPIPVISLTRGNLGAIPPYSPHIQCTDSPALNSPSKDLTDSVQAQQSPRISTLRGAESFSDTPKSGRSKDHRMKIWLTRISWNRQVEIVD